MNNYQELKDIELQSINGGGKIPGWIGLVEPAWDFLKGFGKGFADVAKNS